MHKRVNILPHPVMEYHMSNEFYFSPFLALILESAYCTFIFEAKEIIIGLSWFLFWIGAYFGIKFALAREWHTTFDYVDSQRNIMTNCTCLFLMGTSERNGRRDKSEQKTGWFFFLPETWTMTAESGKNEGVNRSDYKGGLMVLTVPVWQANSTPDR